MPRAPTEAQVQAAFRRAETLAYWLDDRYGIPGTRFRIGFDGLIGLVPGIGDLVTNSLTAYIIYEAWRLGIPRGTLVRMLANLGIDTAVGVVPLVGDLLDIGFKANRRNLGLLRRHLSERGALKTAPAESLAPAASRPG